MYPTKSLRYFLYARKSNEGDDRQVKSIEDQIADMTSFAQDRKMKVVEVFSESKSAKAPYQRQVFGQMIQRVQSGEANGILTWKLNRLARNPIDGGTISWMLQQGVLQHIQTYNTQHFPHDNVLMMQVEFGMANQYSRDLSEVVKRGLRRRAERGWYPGRRLPIGYAQNPRRKQDNQAPEIIPDEKRFRKVQKVWDAFLTKKLSLKQIKAFGDSLGLRYGNTPMGTSNYWRMFTNQFYCGYFTWKDDHGELKTYRGKHKIVVTETQFEQAQILLKSRRSLRKSKKYSFPFRGCFSCGECGRSITAEHKLQVVCTGCKYKFSIKTKDTCPRCSLPLKEMLEPKVIEKTYYRCTKSKVRCSQKYVEAQDLWSQLTEMIKQIRVPLHFINWARKELDLIEKIEVKDALMVVADLESREKVLTQKVDRAVALRAEGEITSAELQKIRKKADQELRETRIKLSQLKDQQGNWVKSTHQYLDIAESFLEGQKVDLNEMRAIVLKIGSNLTVKDKKLCYSLKLPFLVFREMYEIIHFPKRGFEQEIHVVNPRVLKDFDTPHSRVRTLWQIIRTDFFVETLANRGAGLDEENLQGNFSTEEAETVRKITKSVFAQFTLARQGLVKSAIGQNWYNQSTVPPNKILAMLQ